MTTTKTTMKLALVSALGVTLAGAAAPVRAEGGFGMQPLASGYQVAQADAAVDGQKAAEGKCGGAAKAKDGKCGGAAKAKDGKCGEGKCGAGKQKAKDGKCGEGKCGAAGKEKAKDGKCGASKAEEGKCGGKK